MNRRLVVAASLAVLGFSACTQPSVSLPTCAAGEGVTSDGSALKCQALPKETNLPNCSAGMFVTVLNGQPSCAIPSSGGMLTVPPAPRARRSPATARRSTASTPWRCPPAPAVRF
jgi:hypothetical protein